MTELEECRAQLQKLKTRLKEYQVKFKESKTAEARSALKIKMGAYRAAIKDVQVQLDHFDPPEQRKARREQRKRLDIGAMSFDFFERSNIVWSDLEGHSWEQLKNDEFTETNESMEQLQSWMAESSYRLTERQRLYMDAYYNDGLSMERIAEMYNVTQSTVSRVIRNGLNRMQEWIDSKKMIASCSDGHGGFDWPKYLSQIPVLTDRQRQLMLLVLSKYPKNQHELATKLELEQSTVSRTLSKAGQTIRKLGASGVSTHRVILENWPQADKYSLSIQTGMPLYFYYRYCFRGQRIGGVSRYVYEVSRRLEVGESFEKVAKELGLKPNTIRGIYYRLRRDNIHVGDIPVPTDDTIGSRIDPETYVKLQRMVTSHVDS